jgi:hypothetical protein
MANKKEGSKGLLKNIQIDSYKKTEKSEDYVKPVGKVKKIRRTYVLHPDTLSMLDELKVFVFKGEGKSYSEIIEDALNDYYNKHNNT